jgi:hypothetical protein
MEDFTDTPDDELLESAQQIAREADRRGLGLLHSLGEIAGDGVEITGPYETGHKEVDLFLEPGSPTAKAYAHQTGTSGRLQWMERFSQIDMFGRPTVFSDRFDPLD